MLAHRRLINLDLNLLVTLDILLRECNVTRAAEHMGLSQPAVSASLARLRRHFDDDLLTRVGNRYELTPLAGRLAQLTPLALGGVAQVFDATPEFDPNTVEREFTVFASDYVSSVLAPEILDVIGAQAPGVQLRLQANSPYVVDHAAETLRAVDGMVMPHGFLSDFPHIELYRDTWVAIVDENNDTVGETLTLDDLRDLPWVVLFDLPTAYAPGLRQLLVSGVEARADVVVDSFLPMPFLVRGSNRIALVQKRLAELMTPLAGLRILDCPVELPPVVEAFWWHPVYHDDPVHTWFRNALGTAAARLADPAPDQSITQPDGNQHR